MDATISGYADKIMAEIVGDVEAGIVPAGVASFSELHDHVDANDYAQAAGVPVYVAGAEDPWALVNAVEAEVDRRLRERGDT
jgi:hypothetical protein